MSSDEIRWLTMTLDAISALGNGDVLIEGGGATNGQDKIVQHNGRGTVTIRGGTYTNSGKLYRSCGDCTGMCFSLTCSAEGRREC